MQILYQLLFLGIGFDEEVSYGSRNSIQFNM